MAAIGKSARVCETCGSPIETTSAGDLGCIACLIGTGLDAEAEQSDAAFASGNGRIKENDEIRMTNVELIVHAPRAKSGAAAPPSTTWLPFSPPISRLRFGVRRCSGAFAFSDR